jgi:DNA-binding NarL/FixJ family response regulator
LSVSIVIADAQFLIRKGLERVLEREDDFDIVGEAKNENELIDMLSTQPVDVVIMDYDQPGHFTIESIDKIRSNSPFSGVMVVSGNTTRHGIQHVVDRGVSSFITKQCDDQEIINAVRATSRKEKFFCHRVLETILQQSFYKQEEKEEPIPLSPREIEIVQHIATGRIAKEIANELHLSTHTIYTHRKNIMRKLDLSSPVELVMYAINKGLVDPKNM